MASPLPLERLVTEVTHTSGWDPCDGKALLVIGTVEYTTSPELVLLRTVPTAPRGSSNAQLRDEFLLTFVDKDMTADDARYEYTRMRRQLRIVKHVRVAARGDSHPLGTRMNGDVTLNFCVRGDFSGALDGLHVIIPGKSIEQVEHFGPDSEGLTIQQLFQRTRQLSCDYLVVLGPVTTATTTSSKSKPLQLMSTRSNSASSRNEEAETKRGGGAFISSSKWTPPTQRGRALLVYAHSSLREGLAADDGYAMQEGEFMVSYTNPLSVAYSMEIDQAIETTKETFTLPLALNPAAVARINGHWTPNYGLSCRANDPTDKAGLMGFWVLDPSKRTMVQVESWKDGGQTSVRELFSATLAKHNCDYLVVLGCKSATGMERVEKTRKEMLRVLQEMENYQQDANLVAWGIASVSGLSVRCDMETWDPQIKKRVVAAVLQGMRCFGETNEKLAEQGCFAVSRMVSMMVRVDCIAVSRMVPVATIVATGGIPILVAVLKTHGPTNIKVAEYGCLTFANLADDDDSRVAIADAGGIPLIVGVVQNHGPMNIKVAEYGCLTLANLARNDENRVTIAAAGGIPVVVGMINTHGTLVAEVASRGCLALASLANNAENRIAIAAAGGIPVIVVVVAIHGTTNELVAEYGCIAFFTISSNNADNSVAIAAAGGIPVLVGVLKTYGATIEKVAAYGCGAMSNLISGSEINNADNRRVIVAIGGILVLVEVFKIHGPTNSTVAMMVCSALGNLAFHAANRVTIADAGGIPVIVSVVQTQGLTNAKVAELGCFVLRNLAINNQNNKESIRDANGIKVVKEMKLKWLNNVQVQRFADSVLAQIFVRGTAAIGVDTDSKCGKCSQGLKQYTVLRQIPIMCDRCNVTVPHDQDGYGCDQCNYDLCRSCGFSRSNSHAGSSSATKSYCAIQ